MTLKIRLLGLPQIDQGETAVTLRGQKPLALLAYLLLTEKSHSRQHLMDLLHEDTSDPRASLRWTLYHLRQGIGDSYLVADRQEIGLKATAEIWCDVPHFLAGDLELYRGDLLTDLDMPDSPRFMEWLFFERERLRTHYQNALAAQLQASEARGDYPAMVAAAHKLLQLDNLREKWLRAAMRGYAALGKRQAALAEYERGREQLQTELGVEPAPATIALYEEIKQPPASTTAVAPRPTLHSRVRAHNLPATATLFFGREEEQTRLESLLNNPDYRLVTLTGEGGCGKTRLAVTMAHRLLPAFAQGAWFVPLADVNPAEAGSMPVLAQAIAGALRFTFSQRPEPEQQLLDYLRQKEMLLLLDNCEHLDREVDWLVDLLQEAAAVTLLATSRTPLRLQAEYIVPLDGLPVPELTEPPATIRTYSSIQLFDERASRTGTQLNLQNGYLADVVRICHSVQGLPLGIELAAAWANQVSPPVILRQIEADLDFLATTMRDVPARHRSLRAIFNTSWQLLTEAEQQALAQLAVFRGGFDATAAAAIANASTDRLNGLVEKSLLQIVDSDRYQMHPLMRQFAREKLDETAADAAVLTRHYHYYLQWVAAQADALSGAEPYKAKAEVAVEMNNIRQAWNQALAAANLDLLLDSHHALTTYWRLAGLLAEGEDSLVRVVAKAKELGDRSVLGQLLVAQSYFHFLRGQPENALQTAQEALALAEQLEDSLLAAAAHLRWGYTALLIQGDNETAQTQFERASVLLETQSSDRTANRVAEVHHGLGIIFMNRGQAELAQQHLQSAIDLYRQQDDRQRESSAQMVLGVNAMSSGQYEPAREIFQEVLATKQAIEDRYGEISVLGNLPAPYFYQGYYS
ncbi:MAG: hypothetical protein CL608_17260, partial [Anaerolineaceae bacterium]|nr:hypothetical protein [Anaerolineaceae bacterium]